MKPNKYINVTWDPKQGPSAGAGVVGGVYQPSAEERIADYRYEGYTVVCIDNAGGIATLKQPKWKGNGMKPTKYIKNVLKTEKATATGKYLHSKTIRLLHAGMGMSTEANEFLDQLKKHIFYGAELDEVNLKEEIGDILWYMAVALHEMDESFEYMMKVNIKKLKARYGERFSKDKAENRDLGKERAVLEKNIEEPISPPWEAAPKNITNCDPDY